MKKLIVFLAAVWAGYAISGPIHTWVSGEYITAADLNANMSHIHNNMVGGHGPRLVNADVSGSAAIAHSKLATPALLPKVWASVTATCATPATCTLVDESGIASIAGQATTGEYLVTFDAARDTANYGTLVSAFGTAQDLTCHTTAQTTTTATVKCVTASTGADVDAAFTFMLLDSSN